MTSNRRSVYMLIALLAVLVAIGGYFLIISPWMEASDKVAALKKEISDLEDRELAANAKALKLRDYTDRSLPSNLSLARLEYELFLTELLRRANIKTASVNSQGSENKDRERIPTLPNPETITNPAPAGGGTVVSSSAKEKPAYQKIATKITMTKVDLRMLGEFLRAYHDTTLMHHIATMNITRKDDAVGSAAARRTRDRSNPEEWKDLEVTIVSEAIVLDGVEDRKSLMSPPKNMLAAIVGNAMEQHLKANKPEAGRFFAVAQAAARAPAADAVASVDGGRFYASIVGRDLFHGEIPKIPDAPPPPPPPPPPVLPPIDQYIRLNEITRRGDGSVSFQLRDLFNNFTYHGDIVPKGEVGQLEVNKNSISPNGKPIKEYSFKKELTIADDGKSSSNYVFQIVAVDTIEGLILQGPLLKSDPKAKAGDSPTGNGSRPGGGGRPGFGSRPGSSSKLPAPAPAAGAIGGFAAAMPATVEIFYYLKAGQTLKDMKKLTANEVREIIKRNMADGFNPYLNPMVPLPTGETVAAELGE
jgi:hypothetical protein